MYPPLCFILRGLHPAKSPWGLGRSLRPWKRPTWTSCSSGAVNKVVDSAWYQPNPNGCWDWWGYLDGAERTRHLTRNGLQMRVIEQMVKAITGH